MTSTNLAHTAPYCLLPYFKTMAEQYHKCPFCNSTPVLPHLPTSWEGPDGAAGSFDPPSAHRCPVALRYLMFHLIRLPEANRNGGRLCSSTCRPVLV